MKKIIFTILTFISFGCGSSPKSELDSLNEIDSASTDRKASLTPLKKGNINDLLTKYTDTSIDTLKVFPSEYLDNIDSKFKGIPLDSSDITLLPFGYKRGFNGCFKFQIDSTHIGLITLSPSEHIQSSVYLFVLDNLNKSIDKSYLHLADRSGDEGSGVEIKSILFKEEGSNNIRFLTWRQISQIVENRNDTTLRLTTYVDLICWDKNKFDTLDSGKDRLLRKFKILTVN